MSLGRRTRITNMIRLFNAEAINGTGSATSATVDVNQSGAQNFGIAVTLAGSAPNVKVECLMWATDTVASAVEPEGMADVLSKTAAGNYVAALVPPPMRYFWIKATGLTGNGVGTTITLYLYQQE